MPKKTKQGFSRTHKEENAISITQKSKRRSNGKRVLSNYTSTHVTNTPQVEIELAVMIAFADGSQPLPKTCTEIDPPRYEAKSISSAFIVLRQQSNNF
jgi:hypothetical protein